MYNSLLFSKPVAPSSQVSVPWMVFGSSGRMRMPRCIVPSFTHRFPYDFRLKGRDDRRQRRRLSDFNPAAYEFDSRYSNSSSSSRGSTRKKFNSNSSNGEHDDGYNFHRRTAAAEPNNKPKEKSKDLFHRRANGVALVKSFVRLDALPNQAWNPTVGIYLHVCV